MQIRKSHLEIAHPIWITSGLPSGRSNGVECGGWRTQRPANSCKQLPSSRLRLLRYDVYLWKAGCGPI